MASSRKQKNILPKNAADWMESDCARGRIGGNAPHSSRGLVRSAAVIYSGRARTDTARVIASSPRRRRPSFKPDSLMASFHPFPIPPGPAPVSPPLGKWMRRRGAELLAALALIGLLVTAVPLFLCMPLCNDATLYDLAARNILHGGTLYHEVFDTNLPGMVWLHT